MLSEQAPFLDAMAQRYGRRPSDFLGPLNPYDAYCIDQAIFYRVVMEQGKGQGEQQNTLTFGPGGMRGSFSGIIGDVK